MKSDADLLERLNTEIRRRVSDPRSTHIRRRGWDRVTFFALVCSCCKRIVKRDEVATDEPAPELAPVHAETTNAPEDSEAFEGHDSNRQDQAATRRPSLPPAAAASKSCDGSGRPAIWHLVADDS